MFTYIAILRALNVGGHTVRMEHLRTLFAELGFARVETFIASGNVHGREIYWLWRTRTTQSGFSGALLEKAVGMPATLRNANTVRRIAAQLQVPD